MTSSHCFVIYTTLEPPPHFYTYMRVKSRQSRTAHQTATRKFPNGRIAKTGIILFDESEMSAKLQTMLPQTASWTSLDLQPRSFVDLNCLFMVYEYLKSW